MNRTNQPLSNAQKTIIHYLYKAGKTSDEIRLDPQLKKLNGDLIAKCTINYWIKRIDATNNTLTEKRPGRPRLLNKNQENQLVEYVKDHPKMVYREVKNKKKLNCSRQTVNNYLLRNKISKFEN